MSEIDKLSTQLFEEARRFLEKAKEPESSGTARDAYVHAALLLGFSSLEAHMNAVAEELAMRSGLSLLDFSILLEQDFSLEKGRFELKRKLKMYRLEDRLAYIFANFSMDGAKVLNEMDWWSNLRGGIDLRNQLVHPKATVDVTCKTVSLALTSILECLNDLYMSVYRRRFPTFSRGLDSSFIF